MGPEEVDKQQAVIYLTLLGVLEVLIFIFTLVSGQNNYVMYSLLRVILLVASHCMRSAAWAAYYTIFALITAFYVFDPVGLWITGHGQYHSRTQNGFALMTFLSILAAVVLGYFYKKALQRQVDQDFIGDANPAAYNSNQTNQHGNYLYRAAQNNSYNAPAQQNRRFQQFSGQSYSLS